MKYEESSARKAIVEHFSNPKTRSKVDKDSQSLIEAKSNACIDNFMMQYEIKDGKINSFIFDGQGCAVSTCAIDIVASQAIGKTIDELNKMINEFGLMVNDTTDKEYESDTLNELVILRRVNKQASRIKCALICTDAISAHFENKK